MIEFRKVNDLYVKAFIDGVQIGAVEKQRDYYLVEVGYTRRRFRYKHKPLISGYMRRLHYLLIKQAKPMEKSILHGEHIILD